MLKALACAIALGCCALPTRAAELQPQPQVGQVPPPVLGKDRSGNEINLENHRGKVVIVTFWASWCGPCRKELPVLAHFKNVVGGDALEVIAVNFKEPRPDFQNLVRANRKLDLIWVHDARGTTSDEYGVQVLPNMFIIDRDGKLAHVHRGYSEANLEGFIQEILELLPADVRSRPPSGRGLTRLH